MLKSTALVLFCFLVGIVSAVTLDAARIITQPLAATVATPDTSIDAALGVCEVVRSKLGVSDCLIAQRPRTITFTLDGLSATDAAKVCAKIAGMVARTRSFEGKNWILQARNPYATDPVATHPLG